MHNFKTRIKTSHELILQVVVHLLEDEEIYINLYTSFQ